MKVIAVNGSPRMKNGSTDKILTLFLEGMKSDEVSIERFYLQEMNIRPCFGELKCWREHPGICIYKDDMQIIYEALREADVLVIATPVYVPLPGAMQNFLNRMVALLEPTIEFREGRTRAKLRNNVCFSKIVLVSTSGWLELENLDRVVHIIQEFAQTASIEFSGALLRPHAKKMYEKPEKVDEILEAAREAGYQLATEGRIMEETLCTIRQPVFTPEEYWRK